MTCDPLKVCHRIYQKRPLHCRDHQENSDDHLDDHLARPLLLVPLRQRQQIRQPLRHLDEVHQIHLDDLRLDEVHQFRLFLGQLHLDHLDEVHQIRLDDRRDLLLVYLDHLAEHLLVEVRQLRRRLVLDQPCLRKMDCCPRVVAVALR